VAVETRPGAPKSRPCVVVAGGREGPHWAAYPTHQFIHTVGTLPCCAEGGCWKVRTVPLGDGDYRDKNQYLCVDVVNGLPRCMDMISVQHVIHAVEMYVRQNTVAEIKPIDRCASQMSNHNLPNLKFGRDLERGKPNWDEEANLKTNSPTKGECYAKSDNTKA